MKILFVFICLCLAIVSSVILCSKAIGAIDADLVAIWYCEEGKDLKDDSENGLDGGIVGDVKYSEGKYGKCVEFPGDVSSYIEVPHSEFLNLQEFTIAAWINSEKVSDYQTILVKSGGTLETRQYTLYTQSGTGVLHTDIHAGGNRCKTYGSVVVCDGKWHHVALTYDGKAQILYVDGQEDPGDEAQNECSGELVENDSPVVMGHDLMQSAYPLQGMLDEVALFKRALTAAEIKELTNGIILAVNPQECLAISWGRIKQ